MSQTGAEINLPLILGLTLLLIFGGGMGFLAWRDHQANARCSAIGGVTYDDGKHCVIGGHTVNTR